MSVLIEPDLQAVELAGGMRLSAWCERVGIAQRTAQRWRDAGKLAVVNRYGIQFITAAEIRRFFQGDATRNLRGIAAVRSAERRASCPAPA